MLLAAGLAGAFHRLRQVCLLVEDEEVLVALTVVGLVREVAVLVDHVRERSPLVVLGVGVVQDDLALARCLARPHVHVECVVAFSRVVGPMPDTQLDFGATRDHAVAVGLEPVAQVDVDAVDLRMQIHVAVALAGREVETDYVQRSLHGAEVVDALAERAFGDVAIGLEGGDDALEDAVGLQCHGNS